ncbi:MAG: hypothetical protein WBE37_25565 [Bryobacteraceae bacterium]
MKLVLSLAATLAMGTMGLLGADQSWTGTISDSMCGATHPSGTPAKQCTTGCVKKGAKYVVVVGDKVYSIANQDAPGLAKYAGDHVKVTGKMDGDTITVAKIKKA